jgi:hypothetical protein
MGLKSAPMTFQRVMELALQGLQWQSCLIYLDDVVIFSKTFDEHIERLSTVLDRIRTAGLKLKPEKCQFFQSEVIFLGHVVSGEGVKPNPPNIMKIKQWPPPDSHSDKTIPGYDKLLPVICERFFTNRSPYVSIN